MPCMRDDFHHLRSDEMRWVNDMNEIFSPHTRIIYRCSVPSTYTRKVFIQLRFKQNQAKSIVDREEWTNMWTKWGGKWIDFIFHHLWSSSDVSVLISEWGNEQCSSSKSFTSSRKKSSPSHVLILPITFTLRSNRSEQALNYVQFLLHSTRSV